MSTIFPPEDTAMDRRRSLPRSARRPVFLVFVPIALLALPALARAEHWWVDARSHTRYMALGDSIAAGRGAMPQTDGNVYLLYRSVAIEDLRDTHLINAAVSE